MRIKNYLIYIERWLKGFYKRLQNISFALTFHKDSYIIKI